MLWPPEITGHRIDHQNRTLGPAVVALKDTADSAADADAADSLMGLYPGFTKGDPTTIALSRKVLGSPFARRSIHPFKSAVVTCTGVRACLN